MHETGIAKDLVERLTVAAAQADALGIKQVCVWLGALSQFSPEHFREHFEEAARGTLAEHASLQIVTSHDPLDPNAQHVVLQSLELEVPDDEGEG
ncbi:hypothetical protein PATSB16_24810 [Pandoraea thiooxydans]|uniref:Hydrogenase nickel incorporation protein HypA n=1 Tax=Pandoraea thiooxydans TaxID=445709 RepID=A0A0G3EN23_9BURK|nr:hydrogenase maturation nickel metallochaperone HypA [Pandoraea thiooxydans]AKJ68448.1 hydrogenase nickel incorporation protein HypA [Pandoraea thiooxydans]APR95821.1 hypothetical protein PATSB16_24810 [Pandoraea thiooxydans]